ncbi:hypothetical protein QAD02_007353 [Eretmocerus hayati]|uniref:Uncharacterized protein n=1 Tax=Eretmocerus hayati TaxID=131215 RepID=A0ACC2N3Q5_9HYME|nr:hypothetical protein QAD02_007353 [Eretmocerus hayati]
MKSENGDSLNQQMQTGTLFSSHSHGSVSKGTGYLIIFMICNFFRGNTTPPNGATLNKEGTTQSSLESAEYDPHKHRNRPHPTTNTETLIHLLKDSLGTGILAMPQAFHNSGYITGIVATILIGYLCTYCPHILVKAQYELCKRLRVRILSYPQIMKVAFEQGPSFLRPFANSIPIIVDGFMIVYQLGICCVYIVLVATSIKQVADQYHEPLDLRTHTIILLVSLTLINYIRNLKLLAAFSTLANIITFIGLGMILSHIFEDLPPVSSRETFGTAKDFSLYFGTILFALEAVGAIVALENNMKTPQNFRGSFGYIEYGQYALGNVTLNLPEKDVLAQAIKIMFAIALFITYALQAYVSVEILWSTYPDHRITEKKNFGSTFAEVSSLL